MGGMDTHQITTHVKAYQRPSTLYDASAVAEGMRKEDVEECKAQSGACAKGTLLYCYMMSNPCMTMVSRHGYPMGMWGVIPETKISGRIWMLGCQSMLEDSSDKRTFLRESKIELDRLHKQYPVLFNVVDARNEIHVRWIQWMGFTFIQKHPNWGPEGRLFYEFVRI